MRITPAIILALGALLSLPAQSETPTLPYRMKAAAPELGSNIKRDGITSRLPYDKTYAELSEKDKAVVRSVYPDMKADDEPPFPARGFKQIYKTIMEITDKRPVEGHLDIAILVDENGNGKSVKVYASPDAEVTKIVAMMMMQEKYKPALCNGQSCVQEFPFEMRFIFTH